MKILLICPPITLHRLDVSPPSKSALLGLGYIAAVLQKVGHTVKILDCLVSSHYNFAIGSDFRRFGLTDEKIYKNIKGFAPSVVGVSNMFTSYFKDAHNIARIAKDVSKDILVVFGGAHTSTFPNKVIKDTNVDILVVGEGEVTVCETLKRYENRQNFDGVKGIVYRVNGEVRKEYPREPIQDLDSIPFPARELLEKDMEVIRQEQQTNKFLMRKPIGFILTSRGCPKECYFCSVKLMWGRKWRMRSAKNVVDEIEFLKNKYGYREFHFVDDNSSVSKNRMYELCDEILKRKLDIKLATPTGIAIETLDKDVLAKMKKAGFYRLCFGIESGDSETQKIIKKRINLSKAKEVISQANKLGFWTAATFIIGFPHETIKEIQATIDFIKKSNLDFAIVYLLIPQPGTEVYGIFKSQGLIDLDSYIEFGSEEWYKLSITYCNGIGTSNFSNKELQNILSRVYKEFLISKVFSFRTYLNLLKKIKTTEDIGYMLKLSFFPIGMLKDAILGKKLSNISMQSQGKELKNIEDEAKVV